MLLAHIIPDLTDPSLGWSGSDLDISDIEFLNSLSSGNRLANATFASESHKVFWIPEPEKPPKPVKPLLEPQADYLNSSFEEFERLEVYSPVEVVYEPIQRNLSPSVRQYLKLALEERNARNR